ncbi:hypothetical protein SKAU_G00042960 [Synaphobranchus kaupii]|uniref:TIR domain-containing protein n=1 Tax=Synaphobranchus kaupii TaxID=118154 RepID=A0A9Q1G2A9_SYNKA|nr:hypothetical protein SKAU_G00042960 [Synaphobranchus kaupii]
MGCCYVILLVFAQILRSAELTVGARRIGAFETRSPGDFGVRFDSISRSGRRVSRLPSPVEDPRDEGGHFSGDFDRIGPERSQIRHGFRGIRRRHRLLKRGKSYRHGRFNSDTHGCRGIQSRRCRASADCARCLGLYACDISIGMCKLKGRSQTRASTVVVKSEDQGIEECITFGQHKRDLSHHNLYEVPSNLPNDTKYLDLSYNNISGLNRGDLAGLPHLCFLKFTHNGLRYIAPSAFTTNTEFHGIPGYNDTVKLKAIIFDRVLHYQYNYPIININVSYLQHVTYLKFSGTGMNISPCNLMAAMPSLETLDVSDNLLGDNGFWWPGCLYTQVFPSLRWLSLSHNRFASLGFISQKTHEMKFLESLDLSFNSITLSGERCSWPAHLTELSLNNNNLGNTIFQCLSAHLQRINLSKTGITAITREALSNLLSLRHLYLSFNSIHTLPGDLQAPNLLTLYVEENAITSITQNSLQGLSGLKILKAGGNPFSCSCDSYWFVTAFNKSKLPDWPVHYMCSNPPSFAGMSLEEYKPSGLSCRPLLQAATVVSVVIVTAAVFGLTFYACDGVWYTKMLWVWITVKRRGYQKVNSLQEASFRYHAFISYSHQDSLWVDTKLVPSLEGAGMTLCVHERDFVPGEWILDNIINCVEQSYKTLFVLSQSFIQSNWCVYELFFAQHRALSVRQDSLVFVLLEPIPADSIPRKFLKLRSLLRQQTYLEWPKEERKRQVFWASLKAMLRTADENVVLKDVVADITETFPLLAHTHSARRSLHPK